MIPKRLLVSCVRERDGLVRNPAPLSGNARRFLVLRKGLQRFLARCLVSCVAPLGCLTRDLTHLGKTNASTRIEGLGALRIGAPRQGRLTWEYGEYGEYIVAGICCLGLHFFERQQLEGELIRE